MAFADLVEKYKKKLTPVVNLGKGILQAQTAAMNPGLAVGKAIGNKIFPEGKQIAQKLSSPQGQAQFQAEPTTGLKANVRQYVGNRYIAPAAQIPYNLSQTFSKNKTIKDRALGGLGAVGGVATFFPDPIQDLAMPAYDYLKGVTAAQKKGQGTIQSYKTGVKSLTGQEYTGLGDAAASDPNAKMALNMAELPIMLLASHKAGRSLKNAGEIKAAAGEIESTARSIRNYEKFTPATQMQILTEAATVAQKFIPEVVKSKDMRQLAGRDPRTWLRYVGTFLEDRLMSVKDPELNVGLKTQSIKRLKTLDQEAVQTPSVPVKRLADLPKELQSGATLGDVGINVPSSKSIANPTDPFYNVKRVGVDQTTQQNVKNVVTSAPTKEAIEATVGKKLSFDEVEKYSQVAKDLQKNFTRDEARELGASALALRQKVADLAQTDISSDEFTEALIRDKSFGTYLARLLGQRRMVSDPSKISIYNKLIGEVLKTGVDPEDVVAAAKGVDFQDANQATAFFRRFVKATPEEWVDKLRYNSMLSSPNTWINNAASNLQGTGILTPIQKTIEGGIDAMVSGITGRSRTRFAGEGIKYAQGYSSSVKAALKNMIGVFKGTNFMENPDIRSIPLATSTKGKRVEAVLDVYAKIQESVDQFFKTLTKGGLEEAYKYRLAKGGKDLSAGAADEANKLLFRGELTEPGGGVISNFIGEGANWVARATRSNNKTARWLAKLTLPFVRTGTNVVKAGIEGNPLLGAVNMVGNGDRTAQAAKMVMGGAVMTVGGSLALADRMTFAEPTGEKQRAAFREAGMQPYAVKIGDKWVSYQRLHPLLGFQLATVAAVHDAYKQSKIDEDTAGIIAKGLFNSLKFVADQSYFKNIGDFVSTVEGEVEGLSRLASNYPTQFIPSRAMMGWITRIIDQYQRKPDTDAGFFERTFQQMAAQIPGLSTLVPVREGASGEPITTSLQDRVINAVSPVRVSTDKPEARQEYEDLKAKSLQTSNESIIRDQVEATGKPQTIDNKTFYQDGDTIQSFVIPEAPKLTGQSTIDLAIKKDYKTQANDVIKGLLQMVNSGQMTRAQAEPIIEQLKSAGVPLGFTSFENELKKRQQSDATSANNKTTKDIIAQVVAGEITPEAASTKIAQIKSTPIKAGTVTAKKISVSSGRRAKKIKAPKIKKIKLKKPKKIKKLKAKKVKRIKLT